MAAKYILAILATVFIVAGGLRVIRNAGKPTSAGTAWLLVGGIFAVVSVWLFFST